MAVIFGWPVGIQFLVGHSHLDILQSPGSKCGSLRCCLVSDLLCQVALPYWWDFHIELET